MTTVIVSSQAQQVKWNNDLCDCCGAPGGAGVFAYAFCCAPCAAGDVAVAAGRDYAMACCVPLIIAGVAGVPVHCCFWSGDRAALASRYGVADENAGNACCLFCCYFSSCLLAQELNHIAANRGKQLGGTVQVIHQMPPQQVMAGYPQQPAPYGAYPPQQQQQMPPQGYPPQGYPPQQYAQPPGGYPPMQPPPGGKMV